MTEHRDAALGMIAVLATVAALWWSLPSGL